MGRPNGSSASAKLKLVTQATSLRERLRLHEETLNVLKQTMQKQTEKDAQTSVCTTGIPISNDTLSAYSQDYRDNLANIHRANALSSMPISYCTENRSYLQQVNYSYSHSLSRVPRATSQENSGRCWLFAALNSMRYYLIRDLNLPDDFELSEAYLFFYDKLERANLYLENMLLYRQRDVNDFELQCLMCGPMQDGGTWSFVVNLINKYGIVPKTVYGESFNSSVSEEMNQILEDKLAQFTTEIRNTASVKTIRERIVRYMMPQIYQLLANFMGEPPRATSEFTWEYNQVGDNVESRRHKGTYKTVKELTPLKYYREFIEVKYNVSNMVVLRNDPRPTSSYNTVYTTQLTANMIGGVPDYVFNLPMEAIKEVVADSIAEEHPVWFACEVQRDFNPYYGLLAIQGYDYENLLGMEIRQNKADGLMSRSCAASHAMAIVGFNEMGKNEFGERIVDKWKIENSWGEFNQGDPGYLQMTDEWFDRHGYEVVVPFDILPEELQEIYLKEVETPVVLPFNDIFGTYGGCKQLLM